MKKVFWALAIFSLFISSSYAASVEEINVLDNNSIEAKLSSDISLSESETVKSDVKVLKDLLVSSAYKDTNNLKKVILELTYELKEGNTYSVLAVDWVEGNFDFKLETIPSEILLENSLVEKINVLDERNLEFIYKNDLSSDEFVYKVLKELWVDSISSKSWVLDIKLKDSLDKFSSYMLLVNSLLDSEWKEVLLDETIYDFNTPDYLKDDEDKSLEKEEKQEKEKMPKEEEKWNLEKVAMNSAKHTPNTWTATSILVLFAVMLSWFYFIKSRKK